MSRSTAHTSVAVDQRSSPVGSGPTPSQPPSQPPQTNFLSPFASNRFELALGVFTLIFLLIVSFDVGVGVSIAKQDRVAFGVALSFIGFNGLHVMFSFANMYLVPAYRSVLIDHLRFNPIRQLLTFGAILGIFLLVHDFGFATDLGWLRYPCIAALTILPGLHGTRQTLGLSLLINGDPTGKSRTWEHRASWLFVIALVPTAMHKYSDELGLSSGLTESLQWVSGLTFAAGAGAALRSIVLITNLDLRVRKAFFTLRYLVRGLSPISSFAIAYSMALHGLEYVDVQVRIFRNSSMDQNRKRKLVAVCVLLLMLKLIFDLAFVLPGFGIIKPTIWTQIGAILSATLTYFHYLTDSMVFRLRDPIIRNRILPMIARVDRNATEASRRP